MGPQLYTAFKRESAETTNSTYSLTKPHHMDIYVLRVLVYYFCMQVYELHYQQCTNQHKQSG